MNETQPMPDVNRKFLEVLEEHDDGAAITEVSRGLKAAVAAVQNTGKAAKVALSITISPASKGKVSNLVLETKVTTKLPEAPVPGSIFYADKDFNLVREDPDQRKLDLKVLPAPQPAPLKTLNPTPEK
jgi:hypothetical protein